MTDVRISDEQAIRAAQALRAAYDALNAYRQITTDLRLGYSLQGRSGLSDIGAFQIFDDFESDGQIDSATIAFANALKANVEFDDGDMGETAYERQHDEVYDYLTENDLMNPEEES